ncbi:hypothetical protein GCM10028803_46770 [Larkinella knui]|uniref:Uncharacterized protein n=1 Tax=Larkinella knui TaxID=2025310 RepID=A0A3P1CPU7_9BACT|nr:hypothetical protein [Larkinella knui]RRB15268.1 hypothetical protein EHT87_12055 [Larkinella knui]
MNTDDLKPIWQAYKDQAGRQLQWSEDDLLGLIKTKTVAYPWYKPYQHAFLNICVSFFLIGIVTGC